MKAPILVCLVLVAASTTIVSAQNLIFNPENVAFDPIGNRYFVANAPRGEIVEIDSLGNQSYYKQGLGICEGNLVKDNILYQMTETGILGFDLATGNNVLTHLSGMPSASGSGFGGVTADTSDNLYFIDHTGFLYKIDLSTQACSRIISSGFAAGLQTIAFDPTNNRLLAVSYSNASPIQAVQLPAGTLSTVVITPWGYLDGITVDEYGNVYVSQSTGGKVYRYDWGFRSAPRLVSQGHFEPSGLVYNQRDDILAIPNYTGDRVDFVPTLLDPSIRQISFSDAAGGNGNGVLEAGEAIDLIVSVLNPCHVPAENVTLSLAINDPAVPVDIASTQWASIPARDSISTAASPLRFHIPSPFLARLDSFFLVLTYDNGAVADTTEMLHAVGAPRLLLVDDDNHSSLESYYAQSLTDLKIAYDIKDAYSGISGATLAAYDAVIWFTGNYRGSLLENSDVSAIQIYLDGGGNLFLTGQGIAEQLDISGRTDFLNGYLRCSYSGTTPAVALLSGFPTASLFAIGDTVRISGVAGANNQTSPDYIAAMNGAGGELGYITTTDLGAVSYAGSYKLVFFSFGFEAIYNDLNRWTKRDIVMARVLDFLGLQRLKSSMTFSVTPGEMMHVTNLTPTIAWTYSAPGFAQQGFQLEVGIDNDWTTAEMWQTGQVSSPQVSVVYSGAALSVGTTYDYRIRLSDGSDWTDWYYGALHTNTAPGTPSDLTPRNRNLVPAAPVLLSFANTSDAEKDKLSYTYELYTDTLLTNRLAQVSGVAEDGSGRTSWQIPITLTSGYIYYWRARAYDGFAYGSWTAPVAFAYGQLFMPGDANGDHHVNVGDPVFLINYIFKAGTPPSPLKAGDSNCDNKVNVADVVYLINYVFKSGVPPC